MRDALRGSLPGTRSSAGGGEGGGAGAASAAAAQQRLGALTAADLRPVVLRDFAAASRVARPSVEPGEVRRYEEYDAKHGARYSSADGEVGGAAAGGGGGGGGGQGGGGEGEAMEEW